VAGVELAGLLASLGRTGEVAERLAEVRRACAADLGLQRATETLTWAASAAGSVPAERVSCSAFALRVALRLAGKRSNPLRRPESLNKCSGNPPYLGKTAGAGPERA